MAAPIAVIDFETTGMAPAQGARATEVAIVLMEGEQVVDRFDSLMRTGVPIPPFIEQLTGISNAMLAPAPPAEAVMREAARWPTPKWPPPCWHACSASCASALASPGPITPC